MAVKSRLLSTFSQSVKILINSLYSTLCTCKIREKEEKKKTDKKVAT